jgi:hypothetical protein
MLIIHNEESRVPQHTEHGAYGGVCMHMCLCTTRGGREKEKISLWQHQHNNNRLYKQSSAPYAQRRYLSFMPRSVSSYSPLCRQNVVHAERNQINNGCVFMAEREQ